MRIIRNEKLINRNGKIGLFASLVGLLFMGVSLYFVVFRASTMTSVTETGILFGALVISLLLTQVSFYYGNRFGRRPRPDEILDTALKGLSGEYTIYHHSTVVPHLLVGPSGVWVLLPYRQKGKAVFANNRWRASGGGFTQSYLRIFAQESLGRPELDAQSRIRSLERFLQKQLGGQTLPTIFAALVFLDTDIEIQSADSPMPAMQAKKLKEFIRRGVKESPLATKDAEKLRAALE